MPTPRPSAAAFYRMTRSRLRGRAASFRHQTPAVGRTTANAYVLLMRFSCPVRKLVRVRLQDEPSVCSVGTDTYDCQALESDCRSLAGPNAVAVGSNSCGCATGYDWNDASCDLNAGGCRCVSESSSTCDSYTFDSTPGSFDDGSGSSNYRNDVDCAWKLRCPSGQNVRLSFSSFSTEGGYDFVRVYDGERQGTRNSESCPSWTRPLLATIFGLSAAGLPWLWN